MIDIQQTVHKAWPDWNLTAVIGQGAYARVYRACRTDGQNAAVKVLIFPDDWEDMDTLRCEGYSDDKIAEYYQQHVQAIIKEITIMQKLQDSERIVRIEDHCVLHPEPLQWIILIRMELLTPLTKKTALKEMDQHEVVRVGTDICRALECCHGRGIVHRDIKPENIFVDAQGRYKLGDFGTAKEMERTRTLSWKGTPNFMAPEIFRSEIGSHGLQYAKLADIYSLGMVLYWLGNCLTLPFVHGGKQIVTPQERESAFQRRISGERMPAPCCVKAPLADAILKACAYIPEERWQSVGEMGEALLKTLDAESGIVRPKKHRVFLLCCVLFLILSGAAVIWHHLSGPNDRHSNEVISHPFSVITDSEVRFPQKDPLHLYIYFSKDAWLGDAQSALWQAMNITPCKEEWIASDMDEAISSFNGSIEDYFQRIRCETMSLWDISVNPWDSENWPPAEAVLFFPLKNVDYSPLVEELASAGIPAYVFSSDDPETVYQEYLMLFGLNNNE